MSDDNDDFMSVATKESDAEPSDDYDDNQDYTDLKEIEKLLKNGKLCQYAIAGTSFIPTTATAPVIKSGVYRLNMNQQGQAIFVPHTITTDDLLILPDSKSDEVIKEVEKFWPLKNLFKKYGFSHKRGFLLYGPPGCLGFNTKISYETRDVDGKRATHKSCSIERLFQRFHRLKTKGKGLYKLVPEDYKFFITSMDEKGFLYKNEVLDVVKSGVKKTFNIRTSNGFKIEATEDHKFFNGNEYVCLKNLKAGDTVYIHNNTVVCDVKNDNKLIENKQRAMFYVKHHPNARKKIINGKYEYCVLPKARAVLEAQMNKLSLKEYIKKLNNDDLNNLIYLEKDCDVHHLDENFTNDSIENLRIYSHEEHARIHGFERPVKYLATKDIIEEISLIGDQETYDICMNGPDHNFVADGFIVHNSGKSATINIIVKRMVEMNGLVFIGASPHILSGALSQMRQVESERQIVVILEDIDTLIKVYGESEVLSILDGESSVTNVCFIATTNYPENLDGRIINRPSRFDRIVKIGMPTSDARMVYLKSRNLGLSEQQLKVWVKETENFSIAHIKELIIGVKCFNNDFEMEIKRLKNMNKIPKSDDKADRVGFGG